MSFLDELYQYQNDLGPVGDLSRELIGIVNDYQAGSISYEDKEELIKEVLEIKAANSLANQEVALRWVYQVGSAAAALV